MECEHGKKIEDIKYQTMIDNQGVNPGAHLSKADFDYLVEQAEKTQKVRGLLKGRWSSDTIYVNDLWKILNE